jgi:putative hydrolase of the HAD superfamily
MRALLFDLDETLMVEQPAAVAAFDATARHAAAGHDLNAGRLALAARARAQDLWRAAPTYPYCRRVGGIGSWEALWHRPEDHSRSACSSAANASGSSARPASWRMIASTSSGESAPR